MKNRIIKFRAWDIKQNKFIKHIPNKEYMLNPDADWSHHDMNDEGGIYPHFMFDYYSFNNRIIFQQFTGLLDKNNKEIYEGDILCFSNLEGECDGENIIGEIKYISAGFKFVYLVRGLKEYFDLGEYIDLNDKLSDFEVIGDNFENSELLK